MVTLVNVIVYLFCFNHDVEHSSLLSWNEYQIQRGMGPSVRAIALLSYCHTQKMMTLNRGRYRPVMNKNSFLNKKPAAHQLLFASSNWNAHTLVSIFTLWDERAVLLICISSLDLVRVPHHLTYRRPYAQWSMITAYQLDQGNTPLKTEGSKQPDPWNILHRPTYY